MNARAPLRFEAMASPWEIHLPGARAGLRETVAAAVLGEVRRLEHKYSRYRDDSVVQQINRAGGQAVTVDEETARLIDYGALLWQQSGGRFDLTSGVLRRVWRFGPGAALPEPEAVAALRPLIGWERVQWSGQRLQMPAGMELDFGGIGKEYAVDRALAIAVRLDPGPVLINGGGDLAASAPPAPDEHWRVGLDNGFGLAAPGLQLRQGAVATSGIARRHLQSGSRRYGHLLDPRSGWPVADAPLAVTVLAGSCSEAGAQATLALLHGAGARGYLQAQGVEHWVHEAAAGG